MVRDIGLVKHYVVKNLDISLTREQKTAYKNYSTKLDQLGFYKSNGSGHILSVKIITVLLSYFKAIEAKRFFDQFSILRLHCLLYLTKVLFKIVSEVDQLTNLHSTYFIFILPTSLLLQNIYSI